MLHVFVSYSRRDAAWVAAVTHQLSAAGIPIWIDQRDIPVTLPWLDEVRDAIDEAVLFLQCDSANWRESEPCAAEHAFAQQANRPVVSAVVGTPPAEVVGAVVHALNSLPHAHLPRTELRVRARDWHRAGRPRSMLVAGSVRRRLAASSGDLIDGAERAFLTASRRRSTRRVSVTLSVLVIGAVGLVLGTAFLYIVPYATEKNEKLVARLRRTNEIIEANRIDPYEGLGGVASLGGDESAFDSVAITRVLASPVPDDAFDLPVEGASFATETVGSEVVVRDVAGGRWKRSATSTDVRSAQAVPASAAAGPGVPETGAPDDGRPGGQGLAGGGPEVEATVASSGQIEVRRDGALHRVLLARAQPVAVALSADRRLLAAAVGREVEVFDVGAGKRRVLLRGVPGSVTAVAFSADGRRLWALAGTRVVSWALTDVSVLLDRPGEWFQSVAPADDPGVVRVVSRAGVVRHVDVTSGEVRKEVDLGKVVYSAVGSPDGRLLVFHSEDGWHVVDVEGTEVVPATGFCDGLRPAFDLDGRHLWIPCGGAAGVVRYSMADGREVGRAELRGEAAGVAVGPQGTVFAGSNVGWISRVDPGTMAVERIHQLDCMAPVYGLAISPDERSIVGYGLNTGSTGCARIGRLGDDGSWEWDNWIDGLPDANLAHVAAFSGSGASFAIAYADGTLRVRPTVNIDPALDRPWVYGPVRDLRVVADGQAFVAATREGVVIRGTFNQTEPSNKALAGEARRRLDRARELGLVG